jgi:hypothetical protein
VENDRPTLSGDMMMNLEQHEIEQFYRVWFPLLNYVNEQTNLSPEFAQQWKDSNISPQVAVPLRDALWEDDSLRERFIAANPANLSAEDLALVDSWQHRIADSFFIYRYLKSYTVFLDGESPPHAYGVLGIVSPIEDILGPYLPIYVKTVLIPFGDRIMYDSLLAPYPISFGGGYRSSLNDTYRSIQERAGVITSLMPDAQVVSTATVQKSNQKVLRAFQKYLGKSGLSPSKMEEHTQNIEKFAQDFLPKQSPPVFLVDVDVQLVKQYQKAQTKSFNSVSFKRFARFLRDTFRSDYDDAQDILDYLK